MSDYMPKCATCEHFESCIMQKHITEMALILWNISREKEKERTVNKPRRKSGRVMTKEEQFVNELIGYIFAYSDDDYMTMECLCRKLHKHELIAKVDGHWQPLDKRCEDCIFVEGSHWCDGCDKTPKGMKEYDEHWIKAKESE